MPRTVHRAPRNSVGFLSYSGQGDRGSAQLNFSLVGGDKAAIIAIHTHNRRPSTMPIQPTDLLLHCWERLDYYTSQAIADRDEAIKVFGTLTGFKSDAGVSARAISEVLAPMMQPFFSTPDEIVKEAVRRHTARQAEDTDYETPGLGQKSLAPHDVMPMQVNPASKPSKPEKELTEKDKAGIKMALGSGMFPIKKLAESYGVSEATIKALADS